MRRALIALILTGVLAGCGEDRNETMCPDPRNPKVHYVADSDRNPAVCQTVSFLCASGFTPFNTECGCGCIEP